MKPGYKTSEFWITALTIIGLTISALSAPLAPKWAAGGAVASGAAYTLSRGLAKLFPPKTSTPGQ